MSRKSTFVSLAVAVLTVAVLVGPTVAADKIYTIKCSLHVPPLKTISTYAAILYFKNQVEQHSNGRLKVQIFPSNQLGSIRESLEGLKMGIHQMDFVSTGGVPSFFPEIQCLDMPYMFDDRATAWATFDGPFGQELAEACVKKTGMRILGIGENGFRNFVTKKKQIKSPADLKGLKIRTMENPAHMTLVKALGANPTPIPWGETYTAVQQGVVEGLELPITLIDVIKFYQVTKYIILDRHIYDPLFFFINEKFFQGLPADLKTIISNAIREMVVIQRGFMAHSDDVASLENLKKHGMVIYSPSEAEKAEFRKLTQPAVSEFIKSKIGTKWTERLNRAIKETKARMAK